MTGTAIVLYTSTYDYLAFSYLSARYNTSTKEDEEEEKREPMKIQGEISKETSHIRVMFINFLV